MNGDKNILSVPNNIIMEDRRLVTVSGVSDVDSFDERTVTVFTEQGELSIRGADLHVSALNVETGELTVDGRIDALIYAEDQPKSGGFFGRMFR